jgi:large subunit ribosomal protein L24
VNKVKIKKNDDVVVLTGKYKGKKGKILTAMPKENKVIVAGINIVKRHQKPDAQGNAGGIISKEMPINASNVSLMDPKSGKATRVGYKVLKDGKKVRVAKKSGEIIE